MIIHYSGYYGNYSNYSGVECDGIPPKQDLCVILRAPSLPVRLNEDFED